MISGDVKLFTECESELNFKKGPETYLSWIVSVKKTALGNVFDMTMFSLLTNDVSLWT